jgi:ATP-binding cassette subfamily C protein
MLPSHEAALALQEKLSREPEPLQAGLSEPLRLERGIELRRVSFSYDESRKRDALRTVDLVIPAGQLTAITGPSGAGKSTLADALMGLLTPDEGEILIDGVPLTAGRLHAWPAWATCPRRPFSFMTRCGTTSYGDS